MAHLVEVVALEARHARSAPIALMQVRRRLDGACEHASTQGRVGHNPCSGGCRFSGAAQQTPP